MSIVTLDEFASFVTHHLGPFVAFRIFSELLIAGFASGVNVNSVAGLGGFKEGIVGGCWQKSFQSVEQ